MQVKYCKVCKRNVGVRRNSVGCLPWSFIFLGFVGLLFGGVGAIVTIPIFWSIALIIVFFRSGINCGVCSALGKYLIRKK